MPPFFSPYGTDAISVGIPYWLDLLTVIIGAISGILIARDRHLDLVGFVGLGLLGGLGWWRYASRCISWRYTSYFPAKQSLRFLRSCCRHLLLGACFLCRGHQNLGCRCLRRGYRWPEALVAQVQRPFSGRH